jgi:parallel beta-helix repeat protein
VENVVVRKPLALIGEKPVTAQYPWNYPRIVGTLRIEGDNIRVKRLRVVPNVFPVVGVTMFNATNCELAQIVAWGDEPGPAIWVQNSFNNTIAYNWATGLDWWGLIRLTDSQNNTIMGNLMISMSGEYGLYLENSSNNKVFHNSFIDNPIQAYLANSENNIWDGDYSQGGNYWSDYNGTDSNGDGIGDDPYVIDENNQDKYPLMNHPRLQRHNEHNPCKLRMDCIDF